MAAHDRNQIALLGLEARIRVLEQLLEVYERSVIEQSDRLYAEQDRMRFQKTLLECQGEASLDGILSVGLDGAILFANSRFSEMWHVPPPAIGSRCFERLRRSLAERTALPAQFLARCAAPEDLGERQEEIALRDGRSFDLYTAPIRSREGGHFGRVWHFRDITVFKQIGRLKDEFVSSVSHELRTPLTSIRGSLDLMANRVLGDLPPEVLSMLKVAQNNCERLERLIDDVLDIEKIEAGQLDFRLQVMELEPLLERSIESMRPYGERLGVDFQLQSQAPGVRCNVDPDRLIQVLQNLLSNAAKFSPPGDTVRIALTASDERVRVSVADRGPGIAPEVQDRIFEKFFQGPGSESRRTGGTGLGLHLARAIVERLGGSLGFTSTPGAGATFQVELPSHSEQPQEDGLDHPQDPDRR